MQQKHHIGMMLFSVKTPIESLEDNLFAATQISKEVEETKIETEEEAKKESHKRK